MSNIKKLLASGASGDTKLALVNGGSQGLRTIDISDPSNMVQLDNAPCPNGQGEMGIDIDTVNKYAYTTHYIGDSVNSFDYSDPTNIQHLDNLKPSGASAGDLDVAWGISYLPDFNGIAVGAQNSNTGKDSLFMIDVSNPSNMSIVRAAGSVNGSFRQCDSFTLAQDNNTVWTYVNEQASNRVYIFNTPTTGGMTSTGQYSYINVPTYNSSSRGICVDEANNKLFVSSEGGDAVHMYNAAYNYSNPTHVNYVRDTTYINGPIGIAADSANELLLAACYDSKGVACFDYSGSTMTRTHTVIDTTVLAYIWGIAVDSDRQIAFATAQGKLVAIDYSNPSSLSIISSTAYLGDMRDVRLDLGE